MAGRISRSTLEELRLRADIVDVVSEYVDLKKVGSSLKGLCPFHREKTPSFFVSMEKGVFHCFGCGVGGDSITFMMRFKNMEYRDAVEDLCERSGVEVKYEGGGEGSVVVKTMFDLLRFGADFYHNVLFQKGNPAFSYLKKRGVKEETARELQIGYGGGGKRDLARAIKIEGLDENAAVECGLLYRRRSGEIVDRFAGRLIFPIFTATGKVAGFAGRAIDNAEPKYINSAESKIYRKKNLLYGLNFSSRFIREEEKVFVVEGYLDWIIMWQAGIKNIVATCGTAITLDQFRILKRITDKVVLLFDGDLAGKKAAVRSIEPAYTAGCSPMVYFPPSRLDPDEWVGKEGGECVREKLKDAKLLMEYIIEAASKKFDLKKLSSQLDYFNLVWKYLKNVKDPVEREMYIKLIASKLDLPVDEIKKRIPSRKRDDRQVSKKDFPEHVMRVKPEEAMVGFLLKHPEYAKREEVKRTISGFEDPELAAIGRQIMHEGSETGTNLDTSITIGDIEISPRISEAILIYEQIFPDETGENIVKLLDFIDLRKKEGELEKVVATLRDEADAGERENKLRLQMELKREIEELRKKL